MTDPHKSTRDETRHDDRLEAFLDGLLDEAQAAAFVQRLLSDPALQRQAELQARIDGALERLFHIEVPSREAVAAALASAVSSGGDSGRGERTAPAAAPATPVALARSTRDPLRSRRVAWAAAVLAAAAAVAWVLAAIPWGGGRDGPLFAARPLVEIYNNAVASGFEPTYECREPERFATTFLERQGTPLQLLAMPEGARMLGLAYVGGLSPLTTAMLCIVDEQPVMVFVDRAASDRAIAADLGDATLRVFRQERDGLVFYEVTPLGEPRVVDLIAPQSDAETGEPAAGASGA